MWVLLKHFPFRYFPVFHNYQNTGYSRDYLLYIMFIFDRCRRSFDAETSDEYAHDIKVFTQIVTKCKFSTTEKLPIVTASQEVFVVPSIGRHWAHMLVVWVGFLIQYLPRRHFSHFFPNWRNTCYLLITTFTFAKWHPSNMKVFERNQRVLLYMIKKSFTEKLTNVTPTRGLRWTLCADCTVLLCSNVGWAAGS